MDHAVKGNTIFIAGVYGTGKSTLCTKLAKELNIPAFSAGDLISARNGEKYDGNKVVKNKARNQDILVETVQKLHQKHERILLAGHFCIFDANNDVDVLPESVYRNLDICQIILLEATATRIHNHLQSRDAKNYPIESIERLLHIERAQSEKVATQLQCKLLIHTMAFTESDAINIAKHINRGG